MNPLDNKEFRHYLRFVNDDSFGTIEITEPIGFDASEFVIEQDNSGYARDVSFMNEEIDLEFKDGFFEVSEPYMLPSGVIVDNLTMGYPFIIEYRKRYGFESEIQYILERNGVEFIIGDVLITNSDELEFVNGKIVQQSQRALAKRREETKVNVFSDEDIDGNYIEPLETTDILLKAKPIVQSSRWKNSEPFWAYTYSGVSNIFYQNPINLVLGYGISRTLSYLDRFIYTLVDSLEDDFYDFGYVDAEEDLTDITLELSNVKMSYFINTAETFDENWSTIGQRIFIQGNAFSIGDRSFANSENVLFKDYYNPNTNVNPNRDEYIVEYKGIESIDRFGDFTGNAKRYDVTLPDVTLNVESISRDKRLAILFNVGRQDTIVEWLGGDIKINVTSTAIDTVIKGVRYIDFVKQNLKSINGFPVIAPRYDVGGEFYDRFVFSGNLIRRIDDKGFYSTLKNRKSNLADLNGDIQINSDNAVIGQYDEFYANIDNGGFNIAPTDSFNSYDNENYKYVNFEYKFKKYEKDRDEDNTIDAVHTETQYTNKNRKASNIKKVEVDDIYDAFIIETNRKLALKETTALDTDDDVFVIDVVPLAPSSRGGFTASLIHSINSDGNLQLLSNDGIPFSLLGFGVGSNFTIINTGNAGLYTVIEIEPNILTLSGSPSGGSNGLGILTEVSYPYTNVAFTNRTNEGFNIIENVLNPDKFSNLLYTIRRNVKYWESHIKTASMWSKDVIKNTFFKNNGALKTQFQGGEIYTEDEDLIYDELQDAILSTLEYEVEIIVGYDDILEIVEKYQNQDTYGGFLRVQDNNGRMIMLYPKKLSYTWVSSLLKITGEQRLERDIVEITTSGGTITINEVGYDIENLPKIFWEINNNFVKLFDVNYINLINFTIFDKISVNGVIYENTVDLAQALADING